jgi:predicted double-glycine peptidase
MEMRTTHVRYGAIKIPLPNVQQLNSYSCGAAAFQAVCCYFGVGPDDPDEFARELKTNPRTGTKPEEIIRWAEKYRLHAEFVPGMSILQLKACLDEGKPVICSMQAYGPTKKRRDQYTAKSPHGPYVDLDGHFIVAIGYDHENIYFEDPSLAGRRGFIPIDEFDGRWHEHEVSGRYVHLGLVIWREGEPAYLRTANYIC